METMDNIFCRKSIRTFTGKKISSEELDIILRVANASPVGKALYDTLHMTIIEKPELLRAIDEHAADIIGESGFHPLYGAPTFIVVSSKVNNPSGPTNVQYSNAAIMVHSMTMAAVDLGVGHCDIWGCVNVMSEDIKSRLELPEGFVPCCGIILGESDEKYTKRDVPEDRVTRTYMR